MSAAGRTRAEGPARSGLGLSVLLVLVIVLVVGLLYGETYRHEFITYDDGAYITENPHVSSGLRAENLRWAWLEFHSANWHPLTWLSHQLDVELFGLEPGPHHLVNAALHALNAVLCFLFLRRATNSTWTSLLVALVFALHPQRVQSVAWASERKDVLAGTFFFLTLLAWERHRRTPTRWRYAMALSAFALGLLAKPMLVTLPLVLLCLDVWPLAGESRPANDASARGLLALLREKLPFFVLALGSAWVTLNAQKAGGAVQPVEALDIPERMATALLGSVAYLRDACWPSGLAFFYPHPALVTPAEFAPFGAKVWLAAGWLAFLTWSTWRLRARFPMWLAGWAWLLVMLLPVIGLVQVGTQFYADRYAYLPLLGPTFGLAFALRAALAPRLRPIGFALGLAIALLFGLVAHQQVRTWKDSTSLCRRALEVTENNYVAHEHLGLAQQRVGDFESARENYEAVLAIAPELPSSHVNLGAIHAQLGRRQEAEREFLRALSLEADFLKARLSLGFLEELDGNFAAAAEHYRIASAQHPDSIDAWRKLGETSRAAGRHGEAHEALKRALALEGSSADLLALLGNVADESGDPRAALAHFAAAERLVPGHADSVHGRAWIHATRADPELRDPARAESLLAGCATRGEGANWPHLRVLAAVHAAGGRQNEAVRLAAEASALAPRSEWERLGQERALYAAGGALRR